MDDCIELSDESDGESRGRPAGSWISIISTVRGVVLESESEFEGLRKISGVNPQPQLQIDTMDFCPGCGSQFSSPDALRDHFNTDGALCISDFEVHANIPNHQSNSDTEDYFDIRNYEIDFNATADDFTVPPPPAFRQGTGEVGVEGEYHESSGYLYGNGPTLLDHLKTNEYKRRRMHQVYYPFADEGEWELAKFLALRLTKSDISQFLKLRWVSFVCHLIAFILVPLYSSTPAKDLLLRIQTNFSVGWAAFPQDLSGRLPRFG